MLLVWLAGWRDPGGRDQNIVPQPDSGRAWSIQTLMRKAVGTMNGIVSKRVDDRIEASTPKS